MSASTLYGDMALYVHNQLPRAIADKLDVKVFADPYFMRTRAIFVEATDGGVAGRKFECELEEEMIGGRPAACRIPEKFLAHLCAVV